MSNNCQIELKNKIHNLQLNERIPFVYCVRKKLANPNEKYIVTEALMIEKRKSWILRKEKYYFIKGFLGNSDVVLNHIYKDIGKKYNSDSVVTGFNIEQVDKIIDLFPDSIIIGDRNTNSYIDSYTMSEDTAISKAKQLNERELKDLLSQKDYVKEIDNYINILQNIKKNIMPFSNISNKVNDDIC